MAVLFVGCDADFEGTDSGDDVIFLLELAPEDDKVVGVGMPNRLSHWFKRSGGLQSEFFNGEGELGERVSVCPSINPLKELVDTLDIELMTSRLSKPGQKFYADIAFIVGRRGWGGHSRWDSVGDVPCIS